MKRFEMADEANKVPDRSTLSSSMTTGSTFNSCKRFVTLILVSSTKALSLRYCSTYSAGMGSGVNYEIKIYLNEQCNA